MIYACLYILSYVDRLRVCLIILMVGQEANGLKRALINRFDQEPFIATEVPGVLGQGLRRRDPSRLGCLTFRMSLIVTYLACWNLERAGSVT